VVRAEDSGPRGCGFESAVYWMDVRDASYYICIEKKKNKGSQMGHTKKLFIKNIKLGVFLRF
jgi:hypothetical protein